MAPNGVRMSFQRRGERGRIAPSRSFCYIVAILTISEKAAFPTSVQHTCENNLRPDRPDIVLVATKHVTRCRLVQLV